MRFARTVLVLSLGLLSACSSTCAGDDSQKQQENSQGPNVTGAARARKLRITHLAPSGSASGEAPPADPATAPAPSAAPK